jgi:hypothetical protein
MTQPAPRQHRPAKQTGRPHLFVLDPDVPADVNGVGACSVCHCMGKAGDPRHTLPDVPEQAEHRRWAGESWGAE